VATIAHWPKSSMSISICGRNRPLLRVEHRGFPAAIGSGCMAQRLLNRWADLAASEHPIDRAVLLL
jgi:GR25 family glycosyltransferase involved in LPS biosynthesis